MLGPGLGAGDVVDVGAGALAADDDSLALQHGQRLAHRAAADAILRGQLRLRGQSAADNVFVAQFLAQRFGHAGGHGLRSL